METPDPENQSAKNRNVNIVIDGTCGSQHTLKYLFEETQPIGAEFSVPVGDSGEWVEVFRIDPAEAQRLLDYLCSQGLKPTPEWHRRTIAGDGFVWTLPERAAAQYQQYRNNWPVMHDLGPVESSDEHA